MGDRTETTLPAGVDPIPLLEAIEGAAAIFDHEGAIRGKNARFAALLAEGSIPTSLGENVRRAVAGLREIVAGERLEIAAPVSSRRAISADPIRVDGAIGALVRVRDLPVAAPAKRPLASFFEDILEHIPVALLIKDMRDDFRLIQVNRGYEEVYGVARDKILGKNAYDLLGRESAEFSYQTDKSIAERGEIVDIPVERVQMPTRGLRLMHTVKVPLKDDDGAPLYLLCMFEDITEQKQAEDARAREEELRGVIEEMSTPVLPVHEGILVVPLVGRLDAARGAQLMEVLLRGVQQHRAIAALIDITGVAVLDAEVAGHLVQATRAAALLGTSCVLVGASPAVARTLVELGIDFGDLPTERDLAAGITYALARQGKAIVKREGEANGAGREASARAR